MHFYSTVAPQKTIYAWYIGVGIWFCPWSFMLTRCNLFWKFGMIDVRPLVDRWINKLDPQYCDDDHHHHEKIGGDGVFDLGSYGGIIANKYNETGAKWMQLTPPPGIHSPFTLSSRSIPFPALRFNLFSFLLSFFLYTLILPVCKKESLFLMEEMSLGDGLRSFPVRIDLKSGIDWIGPVLLMTGNGGDLDASPPTKGGSRLQ